MERGQMDKIEKDQKDQKDLIPYQTDLLKSNFLIGAAYKASLNELRITYACMYALQCNNYYEEPDGLLVKFGGSELKKILNIKGNGFYKTLDPIAKLMTAHSIGWSDPENREFSYISLITGADYKNGVLAVKFNSTMKNYLIDLKADFTPLPQNIMYNFSSAYSFRLYELLRKICFYPKNYKGERNYIFGLKIGIAELKFKMGVANAELEEVRRILVAGGSTPDYEKALEKTPEKIKSYNNWANFKDRCLDKTICEINDKTDITISYDTVKKGTGGKVTAIIFEVRLNKEADKAMVVMDVESKEETEKNDRVLSDNEKFPIWMMVSRIFSDFGLEFSDIQSICEEAKYDIDKISAAHDLMIKSSKKIKNVTGWIISCIRDSYSDKTYIPEENEKKNKFNNFTHRDYDYDELEKMLLTTDVPCD